MVAAAAGAAAAIPRRDGNNDDPTTTAAAAAAAAAECLSVLIMIMIINHNNQQWSATHGHLMNAVIVLHPFAVVSKIISGEPMITCPNGTLAEACYAAAFDYSCLPSSGEDEESTTTTTTTGTTNNKDASIVCGRFMEGDYLGSPVVLYDFQVMG